MDPKRPMDTKDPAYQGDPTLPRDETVDETPAYKPVDDTAYAPSEVHDKEHGEEALGAGLSGGRRVWRSRRRSWRSRP